MGAFTVYTGMERLNLQIISPAHLLYLESEDYVYRGPLVVEGRPWVLDEEVVNQQ